MSRLVRGLLLAAIIACFFVWSTGRAVDNELASGGVLSGRDVGATVDGSLAASRPESAEPPVVKHGVLSERGDISLAAQGSGPRTSGLGGRGTPRSESTIRKTFGTGLVAVNGHGPEWHRWQRVKDKRRLEQTVRTQARTIRRLQHAQLTASAHFFSWLAAADCVHNHEGAWTSNTGNGYYGGLQADTSFQRAYAPDLIHRYGGWANEWPWYAQLQMAYRGWLFRGWQPWPATSRMCGLR